MKLRPLHLWRRDRRGSITVELAVLTLFIFLPMVIGVIDFTFVMSGKAQIASALQSVEVFAWANPSDATVATNIAQTLNLAGQHDLAAVTLSQPPSMSYSCLQSDGSSTPATITFNSGFSAADLATTGASSDLATQTVPTSSIAIGNGIGTANCSSGSAQSNVSYKLQEQIVLPVPAPWLGSTYTLFVTGTIWIH